MSECKRNEQGDIECSFKVICKTEVAVKNKFGQNEELKYEENEVIVG